MYRTEYRVIIHGFSHINRLVTESLTTHSPSPHTMASRKFTQERALADAHRLIGFIESLPIEQRSQLATIPCTWCEGPLYTDVSDGTRVAHPRARIVAGARIPTTRGPGSRSPAWARRRSPRAWTSRRRSPSRSPRATTATTRPATPAPRRQRPPRRTRRAASQCECSGRSLTATGAKASRTL